MTITRFSCFSALTLSLPLFSIGGESTTERLLQQSLQNAVPSTASLDEAGQAIRSILDQTKDGGRLSQQDLDVLPDQIRAETQNRVPRSSTILPNPATLTATPAATLPVAQAAFYDLIWNFDFTNADAFYRAVKENTSLKNEKHVTGLIDLLEKSQLPKACALTAAQNVYFKEKLLLSRAPSQNFQTHKKELLDLINSESDAVKQHANKLEFHDAVTPEDFKQKINNATKALITDNPKYNNNDTKTEIHNLFQQLDAAFNTAKQKIDQDWTGLKKQYITWITTNGTQPRPWLHSFWAAVLGAQTQFRFDPRIVTSLPGPFQEFSDNLTDPQRELLWQLAQKTGLIKNKEPFCTYDRKHHLAALAKKEGLKVRCGTGRIDNGFSCLLDSIFDHGRIRPNAPCSSLWHQTSDGPKDDWDVLIDISMLHQADIAADVNDKKLWQDFPEGSIKILKPDYTCYFFQGYPDIDSSDSDKATAEATKWKTDKKPLFQEIKTALSDDGKFSFDQCIKSSGQKDLITQLLASLGISYEE